MRNDTRYYSSKQEKRVAKAIGGRQVANSGATKFDKGDVKTDEWLIECKTCTSPKSSMSVKKEWLIKNEEEAFAMRRSYSAISIDFGQDDNYYIINEKLFKTLINTLKNSM